MLKVSFRETKTSCRNHKNKASNSRWRAVPWSHRFNVLLTKRDFLRSRNGKKKKLQLLLPELECVLPSFPFHLFYNAPGVQPHAVLLREGRVLELIVCWSLPQSPFLEHTVLDRTQTWSGTLLIGFQTVRSKTPGRKVAAVDRKII